MVIKKERIYFFNIIIIIKLFPDIHPLSSFVFRNAFDNTRVQLLDFFRGDTRPLIVWSQQLLISSVFFGSVTPGLFFSSLFNNIRLIHHLLDCQRACWGWQGSAGDQSWFHSPGRKRIDELITCGWWEIQTAASAATRLNFSKLEEMKLELHSQLNDLKLSNRIKSCFTHRYSKDIKKKWGL